MSASNANKVSQWIPIDGGDDEHPLLITRNGPYNTDMEMQHQWGRTLFLRGADNICIGEFDMTFKCDCLLPEDVRLCRLVRDTTQEAENAAQRLERDAYKAKWESALPFVRALVENCYAEWNGYEYICPFCAAGKREFKRESEWLNAIQEHAEGCTWREATIFLDANAPKEGGE